MGGTRVGGDDKGGAGSFGRGKAAGGEEEHRLDEAHQEWLQRLEEARQPPEEEEEAEAEPSAPKKRKVGEVVSDTTNF